jgi:hypothetical protein
MKWFNRYLGGNKGGNIKSFRHLEPRLKKTTMGFSIGKYGYSDFTFNLIISQIKTTIDKI